MTYGLQTINGANVLTIDENLKTYVFVAKYAIPSEQGASVYVDFACNGYPLVYFQVPWNTNTRSGISMTSLSPNGTNVWRAYFSIQNLTGADLGLYLRVFGRLDLNFPNGSGDFYGVRAWNASGLLIFDSNVKMHRLAGNTYDTELVLTANVPTGSQPANQYDASTTVPFSMQNKSIAANCRGIIHYPEYIGTYTQFDGTVVDQYDVRAFESIYWSNGTQLTVARVYLNDQVIETASPMTIDLSKYQTVYSRLSVIDNNLFN